jgi:uncharacterized protein YrrD
MNQASNFIGKPIVTQSGERLETIDDVIFDPRTHHVLCFLIEPGGWVGGAKILPWTHEYSITPSALIISSRDQVVSALNIPRMQAVLENAPVVIGKKILRSDGRQIGIVNDIYFDQQTGAIQEYEITGGSLTDSSEQRVILLPDDVEFEKHHGTALWVSAATADLIEHHMHIE